jgi:heme-degrading monooxygenase HmoA
MIFEIATIEIKMNLTDEFESGVAEALPLFGRAKGCRSIKLERSIETPSRYRLVVGWDTIEDHVVQFRSSADFQTWRSLVAHTFEAPPVVEHTAVILSGFGTD